MSGKGFLDSFGVASRITPPVDADGTTILKLRPEMLEADPMQPRKVFGEQELQELAESLRRHGQLQPVRVRRGTTRGSYIIVAGERRVRAAKLAGLEFVDAVCVPERHTIDQIREEQIVENLQRSDPSPLECAHAYRSLLERWQCSQAELAKRLGVSPATVSRALALLEAPPETRAAIASGTSVRQATGTTTPRKKTSKPDKRRAVELELVSGFVRVKRGHTVEQLLEELRDAIAKPQRADAAA